MNNLLSYCGLVDARISASEKYLPVGQTVFRAKSHSYKQLKKKCISNLFLPSFFDGFENRHKCVSVIITAFSLNN